MVRKSTFLVLIIVAECIALLPPIPSLAATSQIAGQSSNSATSNSANQLWAQYLGINISGNVNKISFNAKFNNWSSNSSLQISLCETTAATTTYNAWQDCNRVVFSKTIFSGQNGMPAGEQGVFVAREALLDTPVILNAGTPYVLRITCGGSSSTCNLKGSGDPNAYADGSVRKDLGGCPNLCPSEDTTIKDAYFSLDYEDRISILSPADTAEPVLDFSDWSIGFTLANDTSGKAQIRYGTSPVNLSNIDEKTITSSGLATTTIPHTQKLTAQKWYVQGVLLNAVGTTLATTAVYTLDPQNQPITPIAEQTAQDTNIQARGICQSFTGLSGRLQSITLKIRFNQANSDFYPANGAIGENGLSFYVMPDGNNCSDSNPAGTLPLESGRRNDGRPFSISNYSATNTFGVQTLTFTPVDAGGNPSPITLDSNKSYAMYLVLQNSSQTFEIAATASEQAYANGTVTSINPFGPWQSSAPIKDIYFILNSIDTREPVVLVPGILGTKLNRASNGGEVWPNAFELAKAGDLYLDEIQLNDDGVEIVNQKMNANAILEELASYNIYKNIIDSLKNNSYASGTMLFQNPYDWRLNLSTTANGLSQKIQTAASNSQSGKAAILAHSMGGLLTKEYLRQASTTSNIDKIIFLGVPHLGAPKTAKLLLSGDDMGINFAGLGLNPAEAKKISQNMPSVYELLPSQKYIATAGPYIIDLRSDSATPGTLSFSKTSDFLKNARLNQKLLDDANTFHNNLDNFTLPAGTTTYNIVGCGDDATIGTIVFLDNGKYNISYTVGDGTVPLASATSIGSTKLYYSTAAHLDLVKDAAVLEQINNILNGKPDTIVSGLSMNSSICNFNQKMVEFASHSPVVLHIYDSQNHHLGPDANGDIEYGIPNSSYDIIGDNNFVTVPDSVATTYRVVINAYATGTMDFDISNMTGGAVTQKISYLNQTLTTNKTTATLTYSSSGGAPSLFIDAQGDGTPDTTNGPTATVTGTALNDLTPPTIHIGNLLLGTAFYRYSELMPRITAKDADSGLAALLIKFDDRTIAPTGTIDFFFEKLGTHAVTILATDKAGNPAKKVISIQLASSPDTLVSDIGRSFTLGWIKNKASKQDLLEIANKIVKSPAKINSLGKTFLAELEKKKKSGAITTAAYDILKEDVEWMMTN